MSSSVQTGELNSPQASALIHPSHPSSVPHNSLPWGILFLLPLPSCPAFEKPMPPIPILQVKEQHFLTDVGCRDLHRAGRICSISAILDANHVRDISEHIRLRPHGLMPIQGLNLEDSVVRWRERSRDEFFWYLAKRGAGKWFIS
ncbi:hypothetical protein Mapa_015511 [Marchantia paleacea]|nr:hypothetical protein Mapa_015511 [Marchantia paleacea]